MQTFQRHSCREKVFLHKVSQFQNSFVVRVDVHVDCAELDAKKCSISVELASDEKSIKLTLLQLETQHRFTHTITTGEIVELHEFLQDLSAKGKFRMAARPDGKPGVRVIMLGSYYDMDSQGLETDRLNRLGSPLCRCGCCFVIGWLGVVCFVLCSVL